MAIMIENTYGRSRYHMKLLRKLDEWVKQNLITEEQKGKISSYEEKRKEADNRIQYGFMALGGFIISIGLISLIAYNWDALGSYVKLIGGLVVVLAFAGAYIKAENKGHTGFSELFLVLFYFCCLGYIGLVAQVYHLSDLPHRGFMFWGVICLPLLFISKRAFLPFFWFVNFFSVISFEASHHKAFVEFIEKLADGVAPPLVIMAGLMLQFIIWRAGRLLFAKLEPAQAAFSFYMVVGMVATVWTLDILSAVDFYSKLGIYGNEGVNYMFLFFALAVIIGAWFMIPKNEKVFFRSALVLFYAFFLINLFFDLNGYCYAVFNLAVMAFVAIYSALNERRWMFNLFMTFIVIRIIIIYVTAFDGLLQTGIWLIVSGIVTVAAITLWYRYKPRLEKKFKEFLQ